MLTPKKYVIQQTRTNTCYTANNTNKHMLYIKQHQQSYVIQQTTPTNIRYTANNTNKHMLYSTLHQQTYDISMKLDYRYLMEKHNLITKIN